MNDAGRPFVVQSDAIRAIPQLIPRPGQWEPGPEVPWERAAPPWSPTLAQLLAGAIVERQDIILQPQARLSAVLVLLAEGDRGVEVLLTRRSLALSSHPGEVSFPGGRVDPDESAHEAALREAHEEVGLPLTATVVHGELTHLNTFVSRSYIIPVVASIEADVLAGIDITPMTMEVDRVLWTTVSELVAPGVHHTERWKLPDSVPEVPDATLHFFDTPTDVVWGATARILVDLFERAWRTSGWVRWPQRRGAS
ncbi:MAG TPA: CoA pyrophosphatase [Ilumatobacter sp.]|nr:CoA pyrophosphatase [Ilumatobacter sp.]